MRQIEAEAEEALLTEGGNNDDMFENSNYDPLSSIK